MSLVRRQNLCTNPSFEVNVTTGVTGTAATLAQSNTQVQFGSFSCRGTQNTGTLSLAIRYTTLSIAAGTTVTCSCYMYFPSSNTAQATNAVIQIRDNPAANTFFTSSFLPVVEDAWTRVSATTTVPAGLTATDVFFVGRAGIGGGGDWTIGDVGFFDGVMIVPNSAVLGDYFDGDTTDTPTVTYAWTGTAGISPSTAEIAIGPELSKPTLSQAAVRAATI